MVLVVIGGLAAGAYALVRAQLDDDERRPAVVAFTEAWERGDYEAMYRLVDAKSRQANPKISFLADYKRANRAATVEKVRVGKVGPLLSEGIVKVPVTVDTDDFGPLKGELEFKASEDEARRGPRGLDARAAAPGPQGGRGRHAQVRRDAHAREHLRRGRQAAGLRRPRRVDRRRRRRQAHRPEPRL